MLSPGQDTCSQATPIVKRWLSGVCPEGTKATDAEVQKMCDEDVELYRRLCLEEGRVLVISNNSTEMIPPKGEDVGEDQAAPACAPSPLPMERVVQPAISPPPRELLAPPTPPPEVLPEPVIDSNIEFMKFQGEMQQAIGAETTRDEETHIKMIEAMASKDINDAPVIEEVELIRDAITDPPGFELTTMMLLESVQEGSPADKAGFGEYIGHTLVTVNGIPVSEPEQLSSFWTETALLFGFMDMTAGIGPSMAHQLATLNDTSEQKGYVFVRGSKDIDAIGALLSIHLPQGSDVKLLDFEKFTTGAILVELPNQNEAEILAGSLHHSIIKGGKTISAFMVWECRGQPNPTDVVEVINGVAINVTAVCTNSPVSRPRKLDAWQPPPDEDCLESDPLAAIGEWDQFAANAALGIPNSTYSEEAYTTKLDPSSLSEEQRQASNRIAAEIGESINDSTLNPSGEGDQRLDEEALHSAVLRDESKFKVRSTVYVLLQGLEALTELTEENLIDIVADFDGGAERAIVINQPKQAGVIKFNSITGARQCITDLDGAAADEDHRLSAKHLFVHDSTNSSAPQTCVLDGVALCEEANTIKQGTKTSNTLEGDIGDWDQFAANKALGMAESTYNEELYTTKLVTNSQDEERAAQLASEIGMSNKDSLMEADGEGDDDDEEARHSSVNTKTIANQPKPTPDINFIFIRNIGNGTPSQVRELFTRAGCPPMSVQPLEIYRHPPGAALVKVQRAHVKNGLKLHNLSLPNTDKHLEVKLVFPSKVIDGDALTEEIDGVTIDIPT